MDSPSNSYLPYFNRFQKFLGFRFIRSGKVNCNCARYFLHTRLYSWYDFLVRVSFFPNALLHCLYVYLACLHVSPNQGAKCFAHLFGLCYIFYFTSCSTPADMASRIKNSSNYSVRLLLSSLNHVVTLLNSVAKRSLFVCSLHFWILCIYSMVLSLPIHS